MERSSRGEWTAIVGTFSPQLRPGSRPPAASHDTSNPPGTTSSQKETDVLKKAKRKATEILVGSKELYREIALSALSLVPRR